MSFLEYNSDWKKKYLQPGVEGRMWDLIVDEPLNNLASFPFLTPEVCSYFIQQAETHGKWTEGRHEFYPTYDMLLKDAGLDGIWTSLMNDYVHEIARQFYELEGKKWEEMTIEPFIVKYEPRKQPALDFHYDHAHYSTILTLNKNFTGGGTYFKRFKYLHKGNTGDLCIHPGEITHKHAARPVLTGTRYIIVTFCRNSDYG